MKPGRHPRHVISKWKKNKALLANKKLRPFLPEMRKFSRANLLNMLKKHKMVYVKPVNGSLGRGVMRVELKPAASAVPYRYQLETKARSFKTFDELYASIQQHKRKGDYLVQQGIHLLTYQNRTFDLRVMVQKTPQEVWKTTGYIGRLAHPKKIVTNYHSDGTLMPVEKLLSPHMKGPKIKAYCTDLQDLGEDVANHLHKVFPGIREIGADIAVDQKLRPWILEVNTSPDPYIFRKLKDKNIFRTVIRYSRANGRVQRK
ncbi:MAG: YheC/YheD family protein [Paenibacillus macerans]|uniref:YheC/YheD family protein n=1 Tax=Paenibacillus macerans TaxID=44252 RepID=UPI00242A8E82|nr:YheC/YheD family protein [Paenibacillus macerans]MBS5912998.1 YheC/YheD family protein [Paenibacillus macerans]